MTHSHDRTLLASLSFADPDKRDQMHDLACEYLAESAQSQRLIRLVEPEVEDFFTTQSGVEVAISKGDGQYRTTIGFLDVRIVWRSQNRYGTTIVEVKINPVNVGDMLRQINMYREYVVPSFNSGMSPRDWIRAQENGERIGRLSWVLATAFNLDAGQAETLKQSGVHCVRLGDGFTKWFEERQQRPAPKLEEF